MRQSRAFMLALTADTTDFNKLLTQVNKLPTSYKWAVINHDKDDGANHFHVAIQTPTPNNPSTIANKFDVAPNFVQVWRGKVSNLWAYLTHQTDNANSNKYNYSKYLDDPTKFATNIDDLLVFTRQSKTDNLNELCRQILAGTFIKKQLLTDSLSFTYFQNKAKIDKALQIRSEILRLNPPKCQTILVTGESGSGKSYYAQQLAKDLYPDSWLMASAGNDPLQDYSGERCIIFDDFRPQDFKHQDLLALLDPEFRQRSHQSRYWNKVLATQLIILTTTQSIYDISHFFDFANEQPKQIRRRIQTITTVNSDHSFTTQHYNEQIDDYEQPLPL